MSLLGAALLTTRACLMPCAVGTDVSRVVDIFNVAAGTWSTAALSQARYWFAATSLPNAGVAIFAGGLGTSFDLCCSYCRMGIGGVKRMRELVECGCVDSYHVQQVVFPFLMLWTFSHPAPPPPLPHQQRPLRYQQLLPQPPPPPLAPLYPRSLSPLPQLLRFSPAKANAFSAAARDVTPSTVLALRAQQGRTRPTARTAPAAACAL